MKSISRRFFIGGTGLALNGFSAQKARKVLVCLIDGMSTEYIAKSEMPNLKKVMKTGTYAIGLGMMPSLTNVNNASLATGSYPEEHGITANSFFDPEEGKIVEMSASKYLLKPTIFESAHRVGLKTAFVGSKEKVRLLIGTKAQLAIGAEKQGIPMYEAANSYWVFEQGRTALRRPDVNLLYLTTTDYMMHTYAPEQTQSQEHLNRLDKILGEILDDHPNIELYLCADHGMNLKTMAIDPVRVLAKIGIRARATAAIADKHKVHHNDLGGSIYVDLENQNDVVKARDALKAEKGIDEVLLRDEAARRFRLMASRTGDLFVLGDQRTALGQLEQVRSEVKVRTHGSVHEQKIPLLVFGRKPAKLESIVDLTSTRAWEA